MKKSWSTKGMIMRQSRLVHPGDPAKNFSLKDQNDTTFGLFEHSGRKVLLSFHPLAWTEFCAAQMKSLEDNRDILASLDTIAVGISVDSRPCKLEWAKTLGITHTPLLCEFWPHGKVAQQYGIFRDDNGFFRAGKYHRGRTADDCVCQDLSGSFGAGYRGSDRFYKESEKAIKPVQYFKGRLHKNGTSVPAGFAESQAMYCSMDIAG